MASRRIVSAGPNVLDQDEQNDDRTIGKSSSVAPAVPASVIIKLLGFTVAMVVGPIGTYFLTLNTIFRGKSTWAGATAAIMANVVLIAYVVVAFKDDESERIEAEEKARKAQ